MEYLEFIGTGEKMEYLEGASKPKDLRDILAEIIRDFGTPEAIPEIPEIPIPEPVSGPNNATHTVPGSSQRLGEVTGAIGLKKVLEYGICGIFGIELPWASASDLDSLDPDKPPRDMPASRWSQFIADARGFVVSGWFDRARSLGWSIDDLFGADDVRPYARIDRAGLVLLLNGNRVVAISADVAAIETRTGARQTYRRRGASLINDTDIR